MLNVPNVIAPLAAFLIGLCAVPTVRRLAFAFEFMDNPDRWRKLHGKPIALGGGIAVWLATWSGWGVSVLGSSTEIGRDPNSGRFLAALGLSSVLILCLGVIDDRIGLRARYKLAGQVVPAVILVVMGIRIDNLHCFGIEFQLGMFACPVTVIWVLLIVNAFNLVDGMDGFCGSLGLVTSLAIAFLAYRGGQIEDSAFALGLAGALAAFLLFNLPPAKIYLGDAGSMTIGLLISGLSLRSCRAGPENAISVVPAIALVMLPLLDVVTAVGRRLLTGHSIFAPDRGHIHHCLRTRLRGAVAALVVAVCLATLGAGGAVLATTYAMGDPVASLVIALSVGLLTCTNTFGATESRLLLFRLKGALLTVSGGLPGRERGIDRDCHVQGNRDWSIVWNAVVREGQSAGICRIELAIEMASAGEFYHGRWSLPTAVDDEPHWSIVHTLYADDTVAGTIHVSGTIDACGSPCLDKVEQIVRVVQERLPCANVAISGPAPRLAASLSVTSAMT